MMNPTLFMIQRRSWAALLCQVQISCLSSHTPLLASPTSAFPSCFYHPWGLTRHAAYCTPHPHSPREPLTCLHVPFVLKILTTLQRWDLAQWFTKVCFQKFVKTENDQTPPRISEWEMQGQGQQSVTWYACQGVLVHIQVYYKSSTFPGEQPQRSHIVDLT